MSLRFVPCLCLFAGLLSACSGDDAEPVSDAGLSIDLGAFDAGADAGSFDLGSQDLGTDAGPLDLGAADAGPACVTGSRVVSFDTSDGVTLQADLHVVAAGSPLVALFHMIPPANDRSNYSSAVVDAFLAQGISVLNVDRRGAGGSGGTAQDAYLGASTHLDVVAAVSFAQAEACGFGALGLVGASNGTTSVLDYFARATEPPAPVAAVFLTPGSYTEAQHQVSAVASSLPPTLVTWTPSEIPAATWAAGVRNIAPSSWVFRDYTPGGHGTRLLDANPTAIAETAAWMATALGL